MPTLLFRFSFLFILLFHITVKAGEQDQLIAPTCVLFKINRSENKIEALRERKRFDDIKLLQQYDQQVAEAILNDFKVNFTFCKFYFFNSGDLHDVIDKHFDKVSFYDQNLATPVTLDQTTLSHIWIIENNFPPPPNFKTTDNPQTPELSKESRTYANSNDEFGIVSYNERYELIEHKICYNRARLKKIKVANSNPKTFNYVYFGAEHYNRILKKHFTP